MSELRVLVDQTYSARRDLPRIPTEHLPAFQRRWENTRVCPRCGSRLIIILEPMSLFMYHARQDWAWCVKLECTSPCGYGIVDLALLNEEYLKSNNRG